MKSLLLLLISLFFILMCIFNKTPKRLRKTNISSDLYNFLKYTSLDEYTENYRKYIQQYKTNITQNEMEKIAPLSIDADECEKKSGFVLIHGLGDSPFSMMDIAQSIKSKNKCALINIPILPGHSLIPGASLEATYQHWISAVNLAINDLKSKKVESITLIGFSTGGGLGLNYIMKNPKENIKLILLSPAISLALPWYKVAFVKFMVYVGNIKNSLAYTKFHL